jgi:hypothetical protein
MSSFPSSEKCSMNTGTLQGISRSPKQLLQAMGMKNNGKQSRKKWVSMGTRINIPQLALPLGAWAPCTSK